MNISRLLGVFVSILAIVLVAGFASAACQTTGSVTVCTTNTIPTSVVAGNSIPIDFNVTYLGAGTDLVVNFSNSSTNSGTWNLPAVTTINASQTINRQTTITGAAAGTTVSPVLRINVQGNEQVIMNIPAVTVTSPSLTFCTAGSSAVNLTIKDIDVDNNGEGNDNEWELLDEIEIVVEVENVGATDLDDIIVEMGLFDGNLNQADELDFTDADEEKQELGNLDDGDNDEVTFSFKVPADIEDGNYRMVFKTYPDGEQSRVCTQSEERQIDIQRETDDGKEVIVDDIEFPLQATCGETISGSFSVFNIGTDEQDQVLVRLLNNQLGLNEEFVIRDNLNEGDEERLDFSFTTPRNIPNGRYTMSFTTEYEYDKDDDSYDQTSDDDFTHGIQVIGCGEPTPAVNVAIDTSVDSDPVAGEDLDVTVTFRNTGSESAEFEVDASGFEAWAQLEDISDDSFTLGAGESKTVTFTFNVNEDANGAQSFFVEARSAGVTETESVEVEFPEEDSNGGFSLRGNSTLLWVIGAINVVLIVLIIVVAVRLARK